MRDVSNAPLADLICLSFSLYFSIYSFANHKRFIKVIWMKYYLIIITYNLSMEIAFWPEAL